MKPEITLQLFKSKFYGPYGSVEGDGDVATCIYIPLFFSLFFVPLDKTVDPITAYAQLNRFSSLWLRKIRWDILAGLLCYGRVSTLHTLLSPYAECRAF